MELVHQDAPDARFKKANDAMSEFLFKHSRLHYKIKLDKEQTIKDEREYANMDVDFERLRKEFTKAQDELHQSHVAPGE